MKIFLVSAALVISLACGEPDQARGLRGGRGGKGSGGRGGGRGGRGDGGRKPGFLQDKIDEKCDTLECPADTSSVNCDIDKPERPDVDWEDLTEDEKAALKDEKKAKMDDYVDALALCVCCTGTPLEGILPNKQKNKLFDEGKTRGRGKGRGGDKLGFLQDKVDAKCDTLECPADASSIDCDIDRSERPEIDWANLTEEEKMALKDDKKAKMGDYIDALALCVCCTGTPLEDLLPNKEGRMEEKCDALECPADPTALDCDVAKPERPKADWVNLTEEEWTALKEERASERDEFRKQLALCACCTEDFALKDMFPDRPKGKGQGRPVKFGGKFGGKL